MTGISRRGLLTGLAGAGSALALGGCGKNTAGGKGSGQSVKVGYIADFNGASLLAVAEDQKLWTKHGLDPDLKVFTNGPLQIQALGAGDLDVGYIGPGALWLPASGKAKIIAINSLGFADRVIAQPGITSAAGLKGRKVGVPEGTSGDMILRLALEKAGLVIGDVQKVAMDPSTVVTAFAAQQIDAAGIWYPLIDTIKQRVPGLVELAKNEDYYPTTSFPSAFIARNEAVSGQPDLLRKVLRVVREANDYRAAHLDQAIELTAGFIKVPATKLKSEAANVRFLSTAELTAKTTDGAVDRWLTGLNELFVSFGKLPKPVDAKSYYAHELYVAAG